MVLTKLFRRKNFLSAQLARRLLLKQSLRERSSAVGPIEPCDGVVNPIAKVKLSQPAPGKCHQNSIFSPNDKILSLHHTVGLPKIIYPKPSPDSDETKVSTLKNGLRVASQAKFGQFCTVGIIFDSGSRYEVNCLSGMSHFLEMLSFNSTHNFDSKDAIWEVLEKNGGIVDCQGSRDCMIYAASIDSRGLESAIKIISEVTMRPNFTEEEMNSARQTLKFELDHIYRKPEQEQTLMELIHDAAFKSNTIGLPRLIPLDNVDKITREMLLQFIKTYHSPERAVLAGVGCDHDQLVEFAEKYFVDKKAVWELEESIKSYKSEPDCSIAQYTGGLSKLEKDLSNVSQGVSPIPELVHIVLGFESCSHKNLEDFVPICVLNMMMGGGGSFSAGGPGKGMYTRLYLNVLNRYHWMYNATAYNHAYSDSGIFCIHASGPPRKIKDLIYVIANEIAHMGNKQSNDELERAKTQLQSMLLMNLEARPVLFEDIARQVLANGFRRPPKFFMDAIKKVTWDDIQRVVDRLLKKKISLAALGNVRDLPPIQEVESYLSKSGSSQRKRFTIFS